MKILIWLLLLPSSIFAQALVQYVDPLIGTAPATTKSAQKHSEAGSELKGQTFPAVGRPFGMTQWNTLDEWQLHPGLRKCHFYAFCL
jgi:putative alpha-1,2-mannosidase